jgi:uncharacterized protein YndB with AHSA1/START domain
MRRIELMAEIAAPPERVFEVLADHEGMVRWSGAREVVLRHPGDPAPNGVGAVRVVRAFGAAVEEEIVAFDPPKRMEYRIVAGAPVRDYHGEIQVEPLGSGSRVVWRVRFLPKVPGTGWLLERVFRRALGLLIQRLAQVFPA